MPKAKWIAVFDESGGQRPEGKVGSDFSIGAVLFEAETLVPVAAASRRLGSLVKSGDYKYGDVRRSSEARQLIIDELFGTLRCRSYGAYVSGEGLQLAEEKDKAAEARYQGQWGEQSSRTLPGKDQPFSEWLLREFMGKMAPHLGNYGVTHDVDITVYWDRRSDPAILQNAWQEGFDSLASLPQFSSASKLVRFGGPTTDLLNPVARLAGVVAGDVRQFFQGIGDRVWRRLRADGLAASCDPIATGLMSDEGTPKIATVNESLTTGDPRQSSNEPILRGYYKSLLESDPHRHRLVSFCSPSGYFGHLAIEHWSRWHLFQLPD